MVKISLFLMFFPKQKKEEMHIIILLKQDFSFTVPPVALTECHPSFSEAAKRKKRRATACKFYLETNRVVLAADKVYQVNRLNLAI